MTASGLRALALPALGRVIDLAPLREPGPPDAHGRSWRQVLRTGDALPGLPPLGENDVTGFEEIITASTHLGCHVDAPGHRIVAGRASDGTPVAGFYGHDGLRSLGAETLHPVLTRGILFGSGAVIEPGDAVLVRRADMGALDRIVDSGAALIGLDVEGCDLDVAVPVVSNLLLDEVAAAANGPFLFVMSPIRGAGSTGAPVSPMAIL